MKKNVIDTNKLKEILPHGSISEIAQLSNKSIFTVSRVINGKSQNLEVTRAITEYLKILNSSKLELSEALNTLL